MCSQPDDPSQHEPRLPDLMHARVMRITRLTSHPRRGAELFRRIAALVNDLTTGPIPQGVWFGRQNVADDRIIVVVVSAWFDGEAVKSRFERVWQPFGYDSYADLVESFEVEHYEHPGEEPR